MKHASSQLMSDCRMVQKAWHWPHTKHPVSKDHSGRSTTCCKAECLECNVLTQKPSCRPGVLCILCLCQTSGCRAFSPSRAWVVSRCCGNACNSSSACCHAHSFLHLPQWCRHACCDGGPWRAWSSVLCPVAPSCTWHLVLSYFAGSTHAGQLGMKYLWVATIYREC